MKTAISIPDPLFQAAEQFAQAQGLSRSELYARAIQLYLQTHRYHGITDALNQLYTEESSALDPALAAAQARSMPKDDW
jgi:metal-responsive CopG/Arc/MetJ family transcriptional regulator